MTLWSPHRRQHLVTLMLISTWSLTAAGCCTFVARSASGAARPGASLSKANLMCDVQVVAVLSDGTTIPELVKARKNVQIVLWVADADSLLVSFDPNDNPFPTPSIPCQGRFCGLLIPPNGNYNHSYKYSVTVTTGQSTKKVDPHLEVVP